MLFFVKIFNIPPFFHTEESDFRPTYLKNICSEQNSRLFRGLLL